MGHDPLLPDTCEFYNFNNGLKKKKKILISKSMHYLPSYAIHEIVMNINTTLIGFSLSGLLISRANILTKSSSIIPRLS